MKHKGNIFNICANYHFFESFLQFLNDNFSQNFATLKIILPNRRSCREFKEILLKKNIVLIPQIKAISDLSFEDFFQFKSSEKLKNIIDEITKIKVFDDFDYLIYLTKKIQNYQNFKKLEFYQAFKAATNLKNLLEEIERQEISLAEFSKIDDSNLALHRQITLDFIAHLAFEIKNDLLKKNNHTRVSYQNLLIKYFIEILENEDLENPLIIAGSTGSMASSRRLIKAISHKKNGFVFLYNYYHKENLTENHPQFLLNNLVNFLEINQPQNLVFEKYKISHEVRQSLLKMMMFNYQEIEKWQKISTIINADFVKQDLEKNFAIIEANNAIIEAKIIAKIIAKNQAKKIAIIVNNKNLSNLLKLEFERLKIDFNDSSARQIFDSKLIDLTILICRAFENNFAAQDILAILKHPLCIFNKELTAKFEIEVIRQEREEQGLEAIKKYLNLFSQSEELKIFFDDFLRAFLVNLDKSRLDAKNLIKIVENLTKKTYLELINQEEAGLEILQIFEKLKQEKQPISSSNDLKVILSQVFYFKASNPQARIQIISPIEARLLNFDVIFITSLNEGVFPEIESENWLGRKIRKDLSIDKSLQKIGQNAYDFCNYLSNEKVYLTRAKTDLALEFSESPFLTKFKIIAHKIGAKINYGEEFFVELKKENQVAQINHQKSAPRPALDNRPRQFSITEISTLLANPYFIYCKKILCLKELNKIDYKAGYSEFGSFIHKAFELYIKNPNQVNFEEIFDEFFIAKDAKLIWWSKFQKIFAIFLEQNSQFLNCKNIVELAIRANIGDILISGKVDRIIIENEQAHIFDYKTGTIPQKSEVLLGQEPQLTLAALILMENCLKSYKISSLNYWKLANSEKDFVVISSQEEEIELMTASLRAGLEKLFDYFSKQENGYVATDNLKFDCYKNLSRIND